MAFLNQACRDGQPCLMCNQIISKSNCGSTSQVSFLSPLPLGVQVQVELEAISDRTIIRG